MTICYRVSLENNWTSPGRRETKSPLSIGLCVAIVFLVAGCTRSTTWTPQERADAQYIIVALREASAAVDVQNKASEFSLSAADHDKIVKHMRAAVRAANSVPDELLKKLSPGLSARWKGQFIEGHLLRLKNLESPNGDGQAEWLGSAMLDRFAKWFNDNKKKIRIPTAQRNAGSIGPFNCSDGGVGST